MCSQNNSFKQNCQNCHSLDFKMSCCNNQQRPLSLLILTDYMLFSLAFPVIKFFSEVCSGGAIPGRARSKNLARRFTAPAPPCILLCFGNSVNCKQKTEMVTISDRVICVFEGEDLKKVDVNFSEKKVHPVT